MSYSAYAYLSQPAMDQAFQHLGYPAYFRIELAIAKFIGVILLLAPVSVRIKEWVYAGDPAAVVVMPLVFFVSLVIAYVALQKDAQEIRLSGSIA